VSKPNDILKPEIVVFAIKLYRKFCMVFVGWSIEKNPSFSATSEQAKNRSFRYFNRNLLKP